MPVNFPVALTECFLYFLDLFPNLEGVHFFLVFLPFCFLSEPPDGFAYAVTCLLIFPFLRWFPEGLPPFLYLDVLNPRGLFIPFPGGAVWTLNGLCGRS